jgi:hypothetical protein
VTFGGVTALTGTSSSSGAFSGTYKLTGPIVDGTTYSVVVRWDVTETRTTGFTGGAAPTLTYDPLAGVAGDVITISGAGFSDDADITLYIDDRVVNSTETDDRFGPTDGDGAFDDLEFTLPALTPDTYVLMVVDQYGASTGSTYAIEILAEPETTIDIRSTSYVQGDTISFSIISTDHDFDDVYLTIKDPDGVIFWNDAHLFVSPISSKYYVLYEDQVDWYDNNFTLPADAPVGTWNWTIEYTDSIRIHDSSAHGWATGTFTVSSGGISGVNTKLDAISTKLDGMNATLVKIDGAVATLQLGNNTQIITSINALGAKIDSISGTIATLSTSMGTVTHQ